MTRLAEIERLFRIWWHSRTRQKETEAMLRDAFIAGHLSKEAK